MATWVRTAWSFTVLSASDLERADILGSGADPYVVVTFDGENHSVNNSLLHELVCGYDDPSLVLRTPVASGLNPTWTTGNACQLKRPFHQEKAVDVFAGSPSKRYMKNDKSEEIKFTVKDHDILGKDDFMGRVTVKSSDLWKRAFRVDCEGFSEFTEELQLRDQWDYAVGKLKVVFKWN